MKVNEIEYRNIEVNLQKMCKTYLLHKLMWIKNSYCSFIRVKMELTQNSCDI